MPYSNDEIERLEDGTEKFEKRSRLPFGYSLFLSDAKAICAGADLLGCSIDYLLGRTDSPTFAAAATAEPDKCVNVDTWHTGNPPKPGLYIAITAMSSILDVTSPVWDGKQWCLDAYNNADDIVAWRRFPDDLVRKYGDPYVVLGLREDDD